MYVCMCVCEWVSVCVCKGGGVAGECRGKFLLGIHNPNAGRHMHTEKNYAPTNNTSAITDKHHFQHLGRPAYNTKS